MRFLCIAAFQPDANSGAAGTVFAIGTALRNLGHTVDFEWEPTEPFRFDNVTASRLFELPGKQLRQAATRLSRAPYDVVIISQPFAYLAYERLSAEYPRTLFLNRTHGWEARLYDAQARFGFGRARSHTSRWPSRISAALHRRACRRTARSSDAIIAPASLCADFIRSAYDLPPDRVRVIAYGLDADSTPASRRSHAPGRRLLFVGSYLPRKGSRILELLLPAIAADFPDSSMTFVTHEAVRPLLEDRYGSAFGSRLSIHPWMSRESLQAFYSTHDILLFPSLFEGFGKVWMEAMSAGMCVVGFAEGGLPDVAGEGEALTCATGDGAALGRLLRCALDDPARCGEIGRRAHERVRRFSWERNARETIDLCQGLRTA
jgi:glycosyltransferase involved in cell wall biosynthesis